MRSWFSSLELDDGYFKGSVDIVEGADQKGTLLANPTFTQVEIYAPHQVTAEINGVDESATIEKFSIKIETGADNEAGRTIGSRFPRRRIEELFQLRLNWDYLFFSTTQLERFWGTAQTAATKGYITQEEYDRMITS